MKSVLDEYLPREARGAHRGGPRQSLSPEEFNTAVWRTRAAQKLPHGKRRAEIESIAIDYGVNARTLYRWAEEETFTVVVNGWHAVFRQRENEPPRQSTSWVKP